MDTSVLFLELPTLESHTTLSPFSNFLSSRTDLICYGFTINQRQIGPFHTIIKEVTDGIVHILVLRAVAIIQCPADWTSDESFL